MSDRPFSYKSPTVPAKYLCAQCKATGVKLWREYQTVSPQLLCAVCALKDQCKFGPVGHDGMRTDRDGASTDQIGWYVPAVPDEEGVGYWGYTSVPPDGVSWWKALPVSP